MNRYRVRFVLNHQPTQMEVKDGQTLLRALRELGVTSVKRGCEEGECGACTVLIGSKAYKSCMILAREVEGKEVLTSEGLVTVGSKLHPIQKAFIEEGAIQCGFCTPGMIMATYALLMEHPHPSKEEIMDGLSGNLCRCTGYSSIFRAVEKASKIFDAPQEKEGEA